MNKNSLLSHRIASVCLFWLLWLFRPGNESTTDALAPVCVATLSLRVVHIYMRNTHAPSITVIVSIGCIDSGGEFHQQRDDIVCEVDGRIHAAAAAAVVADGSVVVVDVDVGAGGRRHPQQHQQLDRNIRLCVRVSSVQEVRLR